VRCDRGSGVGPVGATHPFGKASAGRSLSAPVREALLIPKALTIAGSDSGGGAGIQADLKTFSAFRVFGTSVITAVTAQNSVGVQGVENLAPAFVAQQLRSVLSDIGTDAAKCGMLSTAPIIEAVAATLADQPIDKLVVDPVMVAKSGDRLLRADAREALIDRVLPIALVVTPNLPEAEVLAGMPVKTREDMEEAARRIHALGPRHVLVKGGHLEGEAVDLLWNGRELTAFTAPRVDSRNTHGTGCTFSAAITAGLSRGEALVDAVRAAKAYVTRAIREGFALGRGVGQLRHFLTEW
jgi:hydroxymethylpyrimidine/phosphomethylpyrimidine kinase